MSNRNSHTPYRRGNSDASSGSAIEDVGSSYRGTNILYSASTGNTRNNQITHNQNEFSDQYQLQKTRRQGSALGPRKDFNSQVGYRGETNDTLVIRKLKGVKTDTKTIESSPDVRNLSSILSGFLNVVVFKPVKHILSTIIPIKGIEKMASKSNFIGSDRYEWGPNSPSTIASEELVNTTNKLNNILNPPIGLTNPNRYTENQSTNPDYWSIKHLTAFLHATNKLNPGNLG
jgi:hypothetical protein